MTFVTYVTVLIYMPVLSLQKNRLWNNYMLKGNSYSESSLKKAIIEKFGEDQRFYTCSAENMDIDELIEFLKMKGKFMSTDEGFTVDITKVCNH